MLMSHAWRGEALSEGAGLGLGLLLRAFPGCRGCATTEGNWWVLGVGPGHGVRRLVAAGA